MAGSTTTSPSGFSYAQAARGRAPAATTTTTAATQTPSSSKVTSGTATPATGTLSELAPGSNWADDVESSTITSVKGNDANEDETAQAVEISNSTSETSVEVSKVEEKEVNGISATSSSLEFTASTSSNAKEDDNASTGPNGTASETTWESKSQASEPAWIAERKERQNGSHATDGTVKGEKGEKGSNSTSSAAAAAAPVKPSVLQESAPPAVNPWLKRAEENKAKQVVSKPAASPAPAETAATTAGGETQRAKADSRRKESIPAPAALQEPNTTSTSSTEPKKAAGSVGKRSPDPRTNGSRQASKPALVEGAAASSVPSSPASWANVNERPGSTSVALPPSVRDEASWPTPLTAQEQEKRDSIDKDAADEKTEEDAAPSSKRKKQEWKVMPVVPNVIWETASMNENKDRRPRGAGGERAGRGGARGRGGLRGGLNGGAAAAAHNAEQRSPALKTSTGAAAAQDAESNFGARGRTTAAAAATDREAMPPPPRPIRAASANAYEGGQTANTTDRRTPPSLSNSVADVRRARSPKKPTQEVQGVNKGEADVPKPIPRASSVGNPVPERVEGAKDGARDVQAPKVNPSEGRRDSRPFEGPRDSTWAPPMRGAKRNGRGRGGNGNGNRGIDANGHAGPYNGNGFPPDFSAGSPYGVPPSPSFSTNSRNSQQYAYPHPTARGGWHRNPRSQSIPIENQLYAQRFGQQQAYGGAQGQLTPLQTYVPGMYDQYGPYPLTAVPFQPYMDNAWLLEQISMQLEYYFSIDNLVKDMYLRKHMDSQGFVFLDFVAGFNRVKNLTQDQDSIKMVCLNSQQIEIRVGEDGKDRLRRRENWSQFVLPMDQRDPAAQTEGPQHPQRPERPQLFVPAPTAAYRNGPASAGISSTHQRGDRNASYPGMNGYPAPYMPFGNMHDGSGYAEMLNGDESRGRTVKSPGAASNNSNSHNNNNHTNSNNNNNGSNNRGSTSHHLSVSAAEEQDVEPDAFPDEQANGLTVLVKVNSEQQQDQQQRVPFHSAASRTFSNGSIDSKSIVAEGGEKSLTGNGGSGGNAEATSPLVNGSGGETITSPTSTARLSSPDKSTSHERRSSNSNNQASSSTTSEMEFFWVKEQVTTPSFVENLPSGVTSEPYVQLRFKALDQRDHAATGTCPYDLDVLYQFWCHFLLRNFNNRMYSEFKYYANEDASQRANMAGLNTLLRFYAQALNSHNPIRERVVKDYVNLVKHEPKGLEGAAFKQLRVAWRNGALNLKNRKKLADLLDVDLKGALDRAET